MKPLTDNQKYIIDRLFKIGVFQFGEFTLKSGLKSPVYVDLRLIVSYPSLLQRLSAELKYKVDYENLSSDCVCGVPYAALPVATCYSVDCDIPMLVMRKEVKNYGTGKRIEGVINKGETCLIVEDTVTYGASVAEVAKVLREHGLQVNDAVVILDRNQGASKELVKHSVNLHTLFTLPQVLTYLRDNGKVTSQVWDDVISFLIDNKVVAKHTNGVDRKDEKLSFSDRCLKLKHARSLMLVDIMNQKKSNLCLSADLTDANEILELVRKVGSEICLLKLHSDAIANFSPHFIFELKKCAENLNFLIMEDRKFADIGNTVKIQLTNGPTSIASWTHFVTVHAVAGAGTLMGLRDVCNEKKIACLIVCEMSSADALCNTKEYRSSCGELAKQYNDIVAGLICQKRDKADDESLLYFTPGVNMSDTSDTMKQMWREPYQAIAEDGNDVIIVGRGIYGASDSLMAAKKYRKAAWQAVKGEENLSNFK